VTVDVAYEAGDDGRSMTRSRRPAPAAASCLSASPTTTEYVSRRGGARRATFVLASLQADDLPRAIHAAEPAGSAFVARERAVPADEGVAFRDLVDRRGLKVVVEP
jgi:hypothetical protein